MVGFGSGVSLKGCKLVIAPPRKGYALDLLFHDPG
jgi:hypothetical protein